MKENKREPYCGITRKGISVIGRLTREDLKRLSALYGEHVLLKDIIADQLRGGRNPSQN